MRQINWVVAAPVLVCVAGLCWGLIGLFSQTLSSWGLNAIQITLVRCLLAAAFLALGLAVKCPSAFKISLRHCWMFVGTGVLSIAFFNVCYFACIQECGLSFAAILLYTAPCFVVLLSALLFKERMTSTKIVALFVAFAGCALVVGIGSGSTALSISGLLFGLGSGVGYALYSIFARFALKEYSPWTVMFYTFSFATCALVPFAEGGQVVSLAASSWQAAGVMLGLALVSTLLPFACYTVGLGHMEAGKASIMAFIEPMVALVVGVTVFHDVLSPLNVVGIAFIVAAVFLLNIPRRRACS